MHLAEARHWPAAGPYGRHFDLDAVDNVSGYRNHLGPMAPLGTLLGWQSLAVVYQPGPELRNCFLSL